MKARISKILALAMTMVLILTALVSCNLTGIKPNKTEETTPAETTETSEKSESTYVGVVNTYVDEALHLWVELSDGTKIDAGYVGVASTTPGTAGKDEGTDGLEYYLLPDDTYGVMAGTTAYLAHVEIPATHNGKPVTQILPYAFLNASNLTSIVIPDSVTSIGEGAFSGCSSLTDIAIPDSVTSIGDSAFSNCRSLTSIVIPDSVTSINKYTFSGCSNLSIYYRGTEAQWNAISNGRDWDYNLENYTITYNYSE